MNILKDLIKKLVEKKEEKIIFILCVYSVIILLLGTLTGALRPSNKTNKSSSIVLPTPAPTETGSGKERKEIIKEQDFDMGNRWKIFSDSLRMNRENNQGTLYNVTCCLYEGDKKKIIIESDNLEMDIKNEIAIFNSSVRVVSSKGETVVIDKFTMDNKKNIAYGEGNVRLVKGDTLIKSDKIQSDTGLQTYNLIGNVKVIKSKNRRVEYSGDLN